MKKFTKIFLKNLIGVTKVGVIFAIAFGFVFALVAALQFMYLFNPLTAILGTAAITIFGTTALFTAIDYYFDK